jgi:CzcA family heavy metal efflux pump
MMRWIVESSLKFRGIVVAVAAAAVVLGVMKLRDMPVDVLPEFGPTTVEIQTEALGLSAPEVEQLITVPMEQDLLNGVPFLEDIRSQSVPGLSRILLIFEKGTDIYRARQGVAERLTQAHALPNVSKPPQMLEPRSSTNRALMIGVSSKSKSPIQMSVLARWVIAPRLMGVQGVANVAIWGNRDRQLQVQVDPQRLRSLGVSLQQVIESTGNALWFSPLSFVEASTPGTGGFIDTANQRLGIQHFSPITTADTLAQVTLERSGGKGLRLGDVASVVEDHQPLIGDAVVNGSPGLMLVVEKFPDASARDVTRGVESAIDSLKPGLSGLQFNTSLYRPATYIDKSIDNLRLALIVGAALLLGALFLFLWWWRAALVGLVAIPLSVLTAVLVLHALGKTMNVMVLAGLVAALVLVIDEAVVDIDNVSRRLRRRREEGSAESTGALLVGALLEVRSVAIYGTLIAALAVVPLFFLSGVGGSFFPAIAVAYVLVLGAALLVALTVTPALSMLLLSRGPQERRDSPLLGRVRGWYGRALSSVVRRPQPVYVVAGVLVLAAIAAAPHLDQSLLPRFKETQLLITWDGAPGTSLRETSRITSLASRELRSVDGVHDVGAHVGRAVTADQVVGVNSGEIWVNVDPDADYDATLASVKRVAAGYPGLSGHVQSYSNERVREVLPGGGDDLVVRIYGENDAVLQNKAAEVRRDLSGIPGLVGEHVRLPRTEPSLQIEVNLAAARRHGIKPGDVRRAAATLLSGIGVGNLFEEQKVFDVVVWGTPRTRSSLPAIRQLLIDTPGGGHVRLGQVAAVRIVPSPTVIRRQAVSRYVDVAGNVHGRDVGAVAGDVRQALAQVDFPLEVHPEVLTAKGQPQGRLILIGIAAAIGIFLLLQAVFGSWRLATLGFLTLPVAVVGGLLAALADGGTLSFGSYFGLLAVFGLAARNGIMLINRCRQLEQRDGEPFGPELVLRGAAERLEPILMTAVCAALVLSPLVIGGRAAGFEVVHPLAVVVLGGLVTSTLVNLFVMPALYLRFGSTPEAEASRTGWLERAKAWARPRRPQEVSVRAESSPTTTLPSWHQTTRE